MKQERQLKVVQIIQNNPHEGPGLLAEIAEARGWEIDLIQAWDGAPVPRQPAAAASLVVILGGQQAVYERENFPYLEDEIKLAARCMEMRLPLVGICLGAQLIAAALGAPVTAGCQREIGWLPVQFQNHAELRPIVGELPTEVGTFHFHGDLIQLPAGATRLASTQLTTCQAFIYRHSTMAFQYHPEVDAELAAVMLQQNRAYVTEAGVSIDEQLAASRQHVSTNRRLHGTMIGHWLDSLQH